LIVPRAEFTAALSVEQKKKFLNPVKTANSKSTRCFGIDTRSKLKKKKKNSSNDEFSSRKFIGPVTPECLRIAQYHRRHSHNQQHQRPQSASDMTSRLRRFDNEYLFLKTEYASCENKATTIFSHGKLRVS
jgi:hypothetical protein